MTPFSSAGTLSRPCAAARFHMSTTFCMNYFSSRFFFARSLSPVSFAVPMSAIMVWCSHIADGNVVAHNLPDMTNASRKNADTNTILVGNTRALMLNFPRSSFGFHTRMHCSDGSGGGCQWMKMTEWMNYAVCLSARPCRAFKFTVFVCFRNYLWYGMSFGVVKVVNVCVRHASGGSHRIRTARITEWMENNNFSKMWDKKKCARNTASSRIDCCTNFMLDADGKADTVVEFILPCAHTFRSRVITHRCFVFHEPTACIIRYRLDWLPISSTCCCRRQPSQHSTKCLISRYQSTCVCFALPSDCCDLWKRARRMCACNLFDLFRRPIYVFGDRYNASIPRNAVFLRNPCAEIKCQ